MRAGAGTVVLREVTAAWFRWFGWGDAREAVPGAARAPGIGPGCLVLVRSKSVLVALGSEVFDLLAGLFESWVVCVE